MDAEKRLIVVAGPNGAGKTTFANGYLAGSSVRYLGADDIAAQLRPGAPEEVKIQAGRSFSRQLRAAIEAGESLLIESTLSGKSFQQQLLRAKQLGYRTQILFVTLDSPDACVRRVQERVLRGGHHVPTADIRRRFFRSHVNFWKVYRLEVDSWHLYFNSEDDFVTVAFGETSTSTVANEALFGIFSGTIEVPNDES